MGSRTDKERWREKGMREKGTSGQRGGERGEEGGEGVSWKGDGREGREDVRIGWAGGHLGNFRE